jgi:threonine/homoserine/homoserine lactone efflux protein
MPAAHTLLVFSLVAIVFVALPGPSNLFVMAQGLRNGARPAVAGAAGCATGALTYVGATAAGLSALIASSATAFAALHYLGAAYLCWLGVAALLGRGGEEEGAGDGRPALRSPWRSYRQGLVVELGNPKVALFFLALFPQFVHDGAGPAATQVLVLGALFVAIGFVSDASYAVASGRLGARVRDGRLARRLDRGGGVIYLGLGGWAAASGSR